MRRRLLVILLLSFSIYMFGCAKKQEAMEDLQEPISMEALSKAPESPQVEPVAQTLEPLPPAGPYKPTALDIQTALKNANFYVGEVDGKLGPVTKKAVEEFQKANALKADGKVGPKTWEVLGKYLNPQPAPAATRKSKSKR